MAIYIRKGLRILTSKSNEYAMWVQLALPNSARANVVNTYLPPASSLLRAGTAEGEARDAVANILAHLPPQ